MHIQRLYPVLLCCFAIGCAPNPQAPPAERSAVIQSPCLLSDTQAPPGIIVGFGQGASLPEARQRAYAHISEQLSVQVRSESQASAIKSNADVQRDFQQSLSSHSEAQLSNLELSCLDQHSTSGQVFLTYRYDQRALATRLSDKLVETLGYVPAQIRWQGPAAITSSPLLRRINSELARRSGTGTPSLAVAVELSWRSAEQNWLLQLGDYPATLTPAELQIAIAWQDLVRGEAALAPIALHGGLQARQISAHTEYRLALKHPAGGYGHLIGIYENGTLDLLRSNIKLRPNQAFVVPETGGVFEAALLDGQSTTDTFLLFVTASPLGAADLPSLNRRSDAARLQSFLLELNAAAGDVAMVQLVIQ